jgi:hypothetical protein
MLYQDLLEELKEKVDELTLLEICKIDTEKLVEILDECRIIEEYHDALEEYLSDTAIQEEDY